MSNNINIDVDTSIFNEKYLPFVSCETFLQIFFGGSSSGKSFFAAGQRLVLDLLAGRNYLVVRKVKETLKNSVYNQAVKCIQDWGLTKYFNTPETGLTITCKLNGMQAIYVGLDNVQKVKSITPKKGVFTDILIEEATEIEYTDYKQLTKRLRGKTERKKRITLLFNPIFKTHWIYTELFKGYDEEKQFFHDERKLIVHSTYKDNLKNLDEEEIYNLENEEDKYYKDVYTYGKWGVIGKVIIRNWKKQDLSDMIDDFDNRVNGIDWGFSGDEAAYIKTDFDEKRRILYCWSELYQKELTNDELKELIIATEYDNELIIADSSEPKSITEFRNDGFNILGAEKGQGSVEEGIKWLQSITIVVDVNCFNLINELSLYRWKEDKDGNIIRKPVGKDHLIDCLRYIGYTLYKIDKNWGW